MTEKYSFFNDVNGDREYDMEEFALYFKQFLSNGIYHRDNVPALLVSKGTTGLQTSLAIGSAYVEGYMYVNDAAITFTHDVADITNTRIDRIILRLDRNVNARNVAAVVKKGTAATTPIAPTLTRNNLVYEISLAQVRINAGATTITSVTDERFDTSVCGLVSSLITVPTDTFIAQWNTFMAEMDVTKADYESSLTTWMNQLNQDKADYEASWEAWFAGIQNQIGVRTLIGVSEPTEAVAGDLWLKTL